MCIHVLLQESQNFVIRQILTTRCSGTHDRSAVTRRTQEEIQVDVFTFFHSRCDVLYCTGNENSQLYLKGSAAVHWLQVWSVFLVYVLFVFSSYCCMTHIGFFFFLKFWIHISQSCCPLFSLFFWWFLFFPLFAFISGFIVSFLCFSSLCYFDICVHFLTASCCCLFLSLPNSHQNTVHLLYNKQLHDFRLPPLSRRDFASSGLLRSVKWVIPCGRFGATHRPHLQGSRNPKFLVITQRSPYLEVLHVSVSVFNHQIIKLSIKSMLQLR
jgi:hypothetical protein